MSTNLATKDPKKSKQLTKIISGIINIALPINELSGEEEFCQIVLKAKQEMNDAQNYFDNVTEPELIDHAIYRLEAAKSHYTYLLRQAKAKGISVSINI
ncbi:MAG: YaaL family protein [Caulobacteraceae bacterium]